MCIDGEMTNRDNAYNNTADSPHLILSILRFPIGQIPLPAQTTLDILEPAASRFHILGDERAKLLATAITSAPIPTLQHPQPQHDRKTGGSPRRS